MKTHLVATVLLGSLVLAAAPVLTTPAHAQAVNNARGSTLLPMVVGAGVGGLVGMLVWPMAVPMGAGAMVGVAVPEAAAGMAAGMSGAGTWGWHAVTATPTLVGAGVGAVAGYMYSR